MIILKKKILAITAGLLTAMALTACGKDPKLTQFKGEIDAFCTEISDIDTAINNVDAESDSASTLLMAVSISEMRNRIQQLMNCWDIWINWIPLFRILRNWIFPRNLIIWNLWQMKPART